MIPLFIPHTLSEEMAKIVMLRLMHTQKRHLIAQFGKSNKNRSIKFMIKIKVEFKCPSLEKIPLRSTTITSTINKTRLIPSSRKV